jgi:hypothetical protein
MKRHLQPDMSEAVQPVVYDYLTGDSRLVGRPVS